MEKVRYELDPHNRLVAESVRLTELPRFRRVLDGYFKVDKQNNLVYHIKSPLPSDAKAPYQVKLRGNWSLTQNHDLRFTLDKWARETLGDELTLQGDIIDVNKNSLTFAVTTRTKEGNPSVYILKLEGAWQADEKNRLTFRVKKGKDEYDILAFDAGWEIGKNYQIIYHYEKAQMLRKLKQVRTLTFQGYWDIKDKTRISYVIDKDLGSGFDFKTDLGIFKDDYIKYELGIETAHKLRPIKRTVILFGTWKIKKGIGLVFEVESEKRKIYNLIFSAQVRLTDKDTILFKLKNEVHRDIGAELELSHQILSRDGQAFIRLLKSRQESAIFVGAGWQW